jgi:hypothetical protein
MKLDPSKPHGTIWGHPQALYEQNGVLFDGGGNPLKPDVTVVEPEEEEEERESFDAFVRNILDGGPIAQSDVYKEAQAKNLNWAEVKNAAALIPVKIVAIKGKPVWSLV